MASRIQRLVFHAGGVLLPTLADCAAAALPPDPGVAYRRLAPAQMEALAGAAGSLAAGEIDVMDFAARAADILGFRGSTDEAEKRIREAALVPDGMPALLGEIAARAEVRLVSDYPAVWLAPALERASLTLLFPRPNVSYVSEYSGYLALFGGLVHAGVIQAGRTLWVDHHSLRTSQAIRQGIDAAIFVDGPRLRRDLGLWRLLP